MLGFEVIGLTFLALLFTAAQFCWLLARLTERETESRKIFGCPLNALLIKCPNTGGEFSTGIQVDAETLARVPQERTHTLPLQVTAFLIAPTGQAS